jgi:hypothetical protein
MQNACLLEQFEISEHSHVFQNMNCLTVALLESTVGGIKLARQERIIERANTKWAPVFLNSSRIAASFPDGSAQKTWFFDGQVQEGGAGWS